MMQDRWTQAALERAQRQRAAHAEMERQHRKAMGCWWAWMGFVGLGATVFAVALLRILWKAGGWQW